MFKYRPLADTMKEHGESTQDIADLLGLSLEEVKDKLNHNRFLTMSQLHKLCEHYECNPGSVMSWSSDTQLIKLDWDKVASFGKPLTVLSVSCGLSRSALSNTSKGSGRVKIENARKIAEILNCNLEDLI